MTRFVLILTIFKSFGAEIKQKTRRTVRGTAEPAIMDPRAVEILTTGDIPFIPSHFFSLSISAKTDFGNKT